MWKKIVSMLLITTIILSGCGSSSKTDSAKLDNAETVEQLQKEKKELEKQLAEIKGEETTETEETKVTPEVEADYSSAEVTIDSGSTSKADISTVSDDDFDTSMYIYASLSNTIGYIIITNNSESEVSIHADGSAYDAGGNLLAIADNDLPVVGPGETSLLYLYFKEAENVDKIDYTLSYSEPRFKAVLNDLSFEQVLNDRNITITATNNGAYDANFVEAHAFFFDASGNLMRHSSSFIMDNDDMIKPGQNVSTHIDAPKDYDHVEVYYTGRSDGKSSEVSAGAISNDDITVTEYPYTSIGNTSYFLILTNNSDKDVKVSIAGKAFDSAGTLIGTNDQDIPVIGAGETTISRVYFNNVENIDKFEYEMQTEETSYFKPVLNDLAVDIQESGNNFIISITNNGTLDASFVQAYALFFDADNNVIDSKTEYVMDSDDAIKPGNTERGQITMKKDYDHYELYLTGRNSSH